MRGARVTRYENVADEGKGMAALETGFDSAFTSFGKQEPP